MKKDKLRISMKGITLITLVVTIVVLIIVASVSIGALTGDNGIINQAKQGKDSAEISEEKEIIDISVAQAVNADAMGNLEKSKLQEKLNSNTGNGITEVIDSGNTLVVKFVEKNRYYEIGEDGKTEGPKELIKDDNVGDISKGGVADGSKENPFQINCIEDLVTFSMMVNGGNTELGIASNQFQDQYVALIRTLDFNSIFSYNDYTTTKYGDLNTDGIVEDIRTELTKTDEGCIGFTPIGNATNRYFKGIFDGQENEIKNIYENLEKSASLFGYVDSAEIKKLTISGEIKSTNSDAAGICFVASKTIIKGCTNNAKIFGGEIGGIAKEITETTILNCENKGKLNGNGDIGGIVGLLGNNCQIINCVNIGNIIGNAFLSGSEGNYAATGGIVGRGVSSDETKIYNCYNVGTVHQNRENVYVYANSSAGGIVGNSGRYGTYITIANVYNIGEIYGPMFGSTQYRGGIVGGYWYGGSTNQAVVKNAYYLDFEDMTGYGKISSMAGIEEETKEFMYSNNLVNALNEYIDSNPDGLDITDWKHWKMGEDGYPIFED